MTKISNLNEYGQSKNNNVGIPLKKIIRLMKNILIPTDFSQNAKNATDYALSLYAKKDTAFTLLNVFYIPYAEPDITYSFNEITSENAEQLFQQEQKRIAQKFPNLTVTISTLFKVGDLVNVVCSLEKEKAYDLIVMGTKGASGLAEIFVGSKTSSLIKNAKTPVLAIPEAAIFSTPKHILFVSDEAKINPKANLDVLKEIAKQNQSKIDALYIANSDENKKVIGQYGDYELELNFIKTPDNLDIKDGINLEEEVKSYVEKHPIDLVTILSTKGSVFHNIFHESNTKRIVMHTKIPLLVMQNKL
jgi:nucleotide-binding universal stress UspA family protein